MPQIQGYQSVTVENYALKCEDYSSDDENVDEFNNKQQNAEVEALRENVAQFENPYVNYNDEWSEEHGRSMMAQYFPQRLVDMPLGFTECPGYIPAFRLKMFSDMANSDYLFVKSIMEDLWPDGFAGRSVTGRASNNASGRSGKATLPTAPPEQSPKVPLEAHKVEYIRGEML